MTHKNSILELILTYTYRKNIVIGQMFTDVNKKHKKSLM